MIPEQHEFGAKTAEYLEAHEVHDLFGRLLRQIIVHQPENPIKFLQDELSARPALTVCVIGPPGIQRSKYCQMLATDFGLRNIQVGKLLRNRKELRDVIESGELVEDGIVIDIVKAEISKAKGSGWVLDGYPRTKVQAQALTNRSMGHVIDRILLLTAGEKLIRERFSAKVSTGGHKPDKADELINSRLQQYQRHVLSIAELFKNSLRQIEVTGGDEDHTVLYNTVRRCLHVRPYSNAMLRPQRVCVVGPCASGRTTQSKAVAKQYGLVHIDLALLLRKHQRETGKSVEEVPPEYVSDEELCAVVGRRLNETDCLRKGWVLDGFPKTPAQAEFLRQSHFWPSRVIHMKVVETEVQNRMGSRRLDPVTCAAYYKSPNSVAVRQRLVQAEYDQPTQVKERYSRHMEHIEAVGQVFPMATFHVDGHQDIPTVGEAIFQRIDNPLPSELAQDPEADQDM